MSDEEEVDYMSENFLAECVGSNDIRPGLTHSHSNKRKNCIEKKKKEKDEFQRKKKRSIKDIQEEKLKDGLSKALDSSNKGFAMMTKMGFKPGTSLGKDGAGITEPIPMNLKSDRVGLGWQQLIKEKKEELKVARLQKNKEFNPTEYSVPGYGLRSGGRSKGSKFSFHEFMDLSSSFTKCAVGPHSNKSDPGVEVVYQHLTTSGKNVLVSPQSANPTLRQELGSSEKGALRLETAQVTLSDTLQTIEINNIPPVSCPNSVSSTSSMVDHLREIKVQEEPTIKLTKRQRYRANRAKKRQSSNKTPSQDITKIPLTTLDSKLKAKQKPQMNLASNSPDCDTKPPSLVGVIALEIDFLKDVPPDINNRLRFYLDSKIIHDDAKTDDGKVPSFAYWSQPKNDTKIHMKALNVPSMNWIRQEIDKFSESGPVENRLRLWSQSDYDKLTKLRTTIYHDHLNWDRPSALRDIILRLNKNLTVFECRPTMTYIHERSGIKTATTNSKTTSTGCIITKVARKYLFYVDEATLAAIKGANWRLQCGLKPLILRKA